MKSIRRIAVSAFTILLIEHATTKCFGFLQQNSISKSERFHLHAKTVGANGPSRRDILFGLTFGGFFVGGSSNAAVADEDESLTSSMFNSDGSLKREDIATKATFKRIEIMFDPSDDLLLNIDGVNTASTKQGSSVRLSYDLPEKWSMGTTESDELYFDRTEGRNAKACNRITVYQAPGKVTIDRLENAPAIGVAAALGATAMQDFEELKTADLIGGRSSRNGSQKFFEFDMALAPKSCGSSADNLGLGFCPFDSIYLLSSIVLDNRLYVMALNCDKMEWKRASSDLRRVRSSFSAELVA